MMRVIACCFLATVNAATLSTQNVSDLEEYVLERGESIPAAKRFYNVVSQLPKNALEKDGAMRPVWAELARQLESFNPIFTATLLKVQSTMGLTGYYARDGALHKLIRPLAGEYGMKAGAEAQGSTHRQLLAEFYESVTGEPLAQLLSEEGSKDAVQPIAADTLFQQMMRDIMTGGSGMYGSVGSLEESSYAVGYNLAVEYVASKLSKFALESWRELDRRHVLSSLKWDFLEIHAAGEDGHAEIGHLAAAAIVPVEHVDVMKRAMQDHDRDFAAFNHRLADMLEGSIAL